MRRQADHDQAGHVHGNAGYEAAPDEVPGRTIDRAASEFHGVGLRHLVVGGANDDQDNHRGQEGSGPRVGDQPAVDRADEDAPGQHPEDRQRQWPFEHDEKVKGEEVRHREDRADRQVDTARQDGQRHRDGDEGLFGEAAHELLQLDKRRIARDGRDEDDEHGTHEHERNDRFHPALFQKLAEHELGRKPVPEPPQDGLSLLAGVRRGRQLA